MSNITAPSFQETLDIIDPSKYFATYLDFGTYQIVGGHVEEVKTSPDGFSLVLHKLLEVAGSSMPYYWQTARTNLPPVMEGDFESPNNQVQLVEQGYRITFMAKAPIRKECVVLPLQRISPQNGIDTVAQ